MKIIAWLNCFLLVICFSMYGVLSGCAETVTQHDVSGSTARIKLIFSGPINTTNFSYYLFFNETADAINLPVTDFPLTIPGQDIDETILSVEDLDSLYSNYFSTWDDFLVVYSTEAKPRIYAGPFDDPNNHLAYSYDYNINLYNTNYAYNTREIQLTLPLDYFANFSTSADYLYLTLLVIKKGTYSKYPEFGTVEDIVVLRAIKKSAGEQQSGNYGGTSTISSAKLYRWEVVIL